MYVCCGHPRTEHGCPRPRSVAALNAATSSSVRAMPGTDTAAKPQGVAAAPGPATKTELRHASGRVLFRFQNKQALVASRCRRTFLTEKKKGRSTTTSVLALPLPLSVPLCRLRWLIHLPRSDWAASSIAALRAHKQTGVLYSSVS